MHWGWFVLGGICIGANAACIPFDVIGGNDLDLAVNLTVLLGWIALLFFMKSISRRYM